MEITPAAIIEELLDPLMMSDLASEAPTVTFERLSANRVLLDFGDPDAVFALTVETQPRTTPQR